MKKFFTRTFLFAVLLLSLATAASAEGTVHHAPTSSSADGYYLVEQVPTYFYDGQAVHLDSATFSYQFNDNGAVIRRIETIRQAGAPDNENVQVYYDYTYNTIGQLTSDRHYFSYAEDYATTITYSYNEAGQLIRKEQSSNEPDVSPLVTSYAYDGAGRLQKTVLGNESVIVTYAYDTKGQCIKCEVTGRDAEASEQYYEYEYDALGNNVRTRVYVDWGSGESRLWIEFENTYQKLGNTQTGSQPGAFTDVQDPSIWYYQPVIWAVSNGITTGMTATEFGPNLDCTRAQAVTFLWRAANCPEPESTNNPFADVADTKDTNWYYKAVLWAVENGITTGKDATHFDPDGTATREQFVTFLWRMEGMPQASGSTFSDVTEDRYSYQAIQWAVENNITDGIGGGLFAPENNCTRAHIVTFLYRDLAA